VDPILDARHSRQNFKMLKSSRVLKNSKSKQTTTKISQMLPNFCQKKLKNKMEELQRSPKAQDIIEDKNVQ
jgi:hypothetical protein